MNDENKDFKLIRDKIRSKKLNPKVDLTAMISVSFLLIIFFMVTKELARPQAIDLGLPNNSCGGYIDICGKPDENRIITLLLDEDNKVISYSGLLEIPIEKPKRLDYGKDGIRKELIAMNKRILKYISTKSYKRSNLGAIVIIKPSKKSNYGNLVDILDEMAITEIPTYAIINDITPEEQKLLNSK